MPSRNDPAQSDPERRPWLQLIADLVAQGVEVRRARIVSQPVSEYIRFEHHLTGRTVEAAEQVRWLPDAARPRWPCLATTSGSSTTARSSSITSPVMENYILP